MPKYETEAAQDPSEIAAFCDLLKREGVKSYLEIGSRYGGSLWKVANALPVGSRVVSVEWPGGYGSRKDGKPTLEACIAELKRLGYDARVVWGESTAPETIGQAKALGPYDALLIDANHTLPFVTKDWANYGPMASIVAFHDISWSRAPDWSKGTRIDVPQFWGLIKDDYRHEEIRLCPTGNNNGIGVLWRD